MTSEDSQIVKGDARLKQKPEDWIQVLHFEWGSGRSAPKIKDRLTGGTVWFGEDAKELKVLWPQHKHFNWDGPVLMRRDRRSSFRFEFSTFQLGGDVVTPIRIVAVENDILATVQTILHRLRHGR